MNFFISSSKIGVGHINDVIVCVHDGEGTYPRGYCVGGLTQRVKGVGDTDS